MGKAVEGSNVERATFQTLNALGSGLGLWKSGIKLPHSKGSPLKVEGSNVERATFQTLNGLPKGPRCDRGGFGVLAGFAA